MRVADYPTIQDYVGEAIIDTNSCRSFNFMMAQAMDSVTNNCDWSIHEDPTALPRAQFLSLDVAGEVRGRQERRACHRQDAACLRRHRLQAAAARDRALPARRQGRLGHGPDQRGAAPVRRQGVAARASASLDYWNQSINERVLNNEVKKMSAADKQALAEKLLAEAKPGAAA